MMSRALPRRHRRTAAGVAAVLILSLAGESIAAGQAPATSAGTLSIRHEAPGCVAAGKYSRLAACFEPQSLLARARVYFRMVGTGDWFYVEMSGAPPCLQGVLPRPKKAPGRIEYYVAATDRSFAETRTPERVLEVTSDGRCPAGPVAPVADTASVVIGSASGAAPAGFVTGGGVSPLLIAGGVAVVGGGAAAVIAGGGGGGESPTTTTLAPVTTTTTTTTATTTTTTTTLEPTPPPSTTVPPTTTTTTTTTTTLPPCETPRQVPTASVTAPSTGPLGGTSVTVQVNASDPTPGSGVKEVRFYWAYCPGSFANCGSLNPIGTVTSAPYNILWVFPTSCGTYPEDRFRILVRAEDNCGNVSPDAGVDVRLTGRGCFKGDALRSATGAWVSDLTVPSGRGQVVVDGTEAVFPAGGTETFSVPMGPGAHRFEATLVDGAGRPGTWRFDLANVGVVPGSLRVVAGEAAQAGSGAVVFRLRGKPGERVVFTFEVGGRQ